MDSLLYLFRNNAPRWHAHSIHSHSCSLIITKKEAQRWILQLLSNALFRSIKRIPPHGWLGVCSACTLVNESSVYPCLGNWEPSLTTLFSPIGYSWCLCSGLVEAMDRRKRKAVRARGTVNLTPPSMLGLAFLLWTHFFSSHSRSHTSLS